MLDALQLGLSAEEFWSMSARAIVTLQREDVRRKEALYLRKAGRPEGGGRRLSRLPRP